MMSHPGSEYTRHICFRRGHRVRQPSDALPARPTPVNWGAIISGTWYRRHRPGCNAGILKKDMRSKRFIGIALTVCLLGVTLAGFPSSPAEALSTNPNDYYSYTYTFTFSKTTVAAGEPFSVMVSGQATCIQELPVSVSATMSSKIVARDQQSGAEVVLNPSYTLSYSDFPRKKGDTVQVSVEVPLVFPADSASGSYSVVGQILQAKARVLGLIDIDVKGYLPSQQVMGTVTCTSSGGGGGGGGALIGGMEKRESVTNLTKYQNEDGEMKENVEAMSVDGRVKVEIQQGVKMRSAQGTIANGVAILEMDKKREPSPPAGGFVIGKTYNLGPDGATFSEPVRLTFSFDLYPLPEGIKAKDLFIAWWNERDAKWVPLKDCEVNETANTVSGMTDHFTVFSIIAMPEPETAPATTPVTTSPASTPAPSATQTTTPPSSTPSATSFTVGGIIITPGLPVAGQDISVTAVVSNTSNAPSICAVILAVDGVETASQSISLEGHSSQQVSFTMPPLAAGDHAVSVNNISRNFTVRAAESLPKPLNWWLVAAYVSAGILAGVGIAIGLAIRKSRGVRDRS